MSFHKAAIDRRAWSVSGAKRAVRWNFARITRQGEESDWASMLMIIAQMFVIFKKAGLTHRQVEAARSAACLISPALKRGALRQILVSQTLHRNSKNLHIHLKELRLQRSLTQESLAQAVGVTRQTIIAIEKEKSVPSVKLALELARALNVSLEDVFWLADGKGL